MKRNEREPPFIIRLGKYHLVTTKHNGKYWTVCGLTPRFETVDGDSDLARHTMLTPWEVENSWRNACRACKQTNAWEEWYEIPESRRPPEHHLFHSDE